MKIIGNVVVIVVLGIFLPSCAKIFYSSDTDLLVKNHNTIAIIPPTVSFDISIKGDAAKIIEQQRGESVSIQKEMYSWMLKRKMQGKIAQEIQDIETTNTKLKRAGYPENNLTSGEICKILGVDGFVGSNFSISKPMSQCAAIAVRVIAGVWGATNEVKASLYIKDCANEKLIWNYDNKLSGTIGSSPSSLVNALMRNASKRMPYIVE